MVRPQIGVKISMQLTRNVYHLFSQYQCSMVCGKMRVAAKGHLDASSTCGSASASVAQPRCSSCKQQVLIATRRAVGWAVCLFCHYHMTCNATAALRSQSVVTGVTSASPSLTDETLAQPRRSTLEFQSNSDQASTGSSYFTRSELKFDVNQHDTSYTRGCKAV